MGLRGPQPTPTNVLKARNSKRADINRSEPRPAPGPPVCPKSLTDEQKKVWRALVKVLEDMSLVSKADGALLERYCVYFVRWRAAEDFIARNGISYPLLRTGPASGGPPKAGYVGRLKTGEWVVAWVEYPQVRESHKLHKDLKDIEDRFGLSPAARSRIRTETETGPRLHDAADEVTAERREFFRAR